MPSPGQPAGFRVERLLLDGLRRLDSLPVGTAPDHWTACTAPNTGLVVDRAGAVRACEAAATAACDRTSLAEAWGGAALQRLRHDLTNGELPLPHCAGCVSWLQDDLGTRAPLLRDQAAPTGQAPGAAPARVVLRLPQPDEEVFEQCAALGTDLHELVLEADDATFAEPVLSRVTARRTVLRCPPPSPGLLHRLAVASKDTLHLELQLQSVATDGLAALRLAADESGVTLSARFVFTPADWHWFEDVATACATVDVPLQFRVLDRDGEVPLAALCTDDLSLIRDVITSSWDRFEGARAPATLEPHSFEHVAAELRQQLRRRAEAERGGAASAPARLALPSPTHPWIVDPSRRTWWLTLLYGGGHLPAVIDWLHETLAAPDTDLAAGELTWLRVLTLRIASDRHPPALLDRLRDLYHEPKQRKALIAEDRAFSEQFDLTRYGGPWSERLGLLHDRGRRRPFAIGKPTPASPGPADVTVLIPSFRHEQYIEETLRSVLAQDHPQFRVLVVDDRSPDQTAARARRVQDPRIEVRSNARNLGLGNSVLSALETIDTPYVALLNSDDLFHPTRLSSCCEVLERDSTVQLVTTGVQLIDHAGGLLTPTNASLVLDGKKVYDWVHWFARITPGEELSQHELFAALLERNFLVTSSNLVARTDWLRSQATTLRSLKYCLDWQLFLQAALEGVLHHLHQPLIAYRLHATNTVWFREGRRWSYFLEVNRVAAEALQRFAAQGRLSADARLLQVVDSVTRHLATNSEMDGLALFLNAALDPVQLDQAANEQPVVTALVEQLNDRAEELREHSAVAEADTTGLLHLDLLLRLARELSQRASTRNQWLVQHTEELELRLNDSWRYRDKLEAEKKQLYEDQRQRIERFERLDQEKRRLYEDQKQRIARVQELEDEKRHLYEDQKRRIECIQELEDEKRRLYEDQKRRIERIQELEDEKRRLYEDQKRRIERIRELEDEKRRLYEDQKRRIERIQELEDEKRRLYEDQERRIERIRQLENEKRGLYEDQKQRIERTRELDRRLAEAYAQGEQARKNRAAAEQRTAELQQVLDTLRHELEQERAELAETVAGLEHKERQILDLQGTHDEVLESLVTLEHAHREIEHALIAERGARAKAESELEVRGEALEELGTRLAAESAQVRAANDAKDKVTEQRNELLHKVANQQKEIERLLGTREFRTGNFLWNKLPLGYMSRRGKKWYRRLLDAKDRAGMWFKRNNRKAEGTAVVTACWQWPIYSHTFVYQEMVSLTHMGLDVRLFHWDLGDTEQLHAAFRYLYDNRTQLQPIWENHKKDKEHFEKTRPGRLRSFLERIAPLSGKTVEQLEKEPIVMQGCTFARMAELAGAKYIHSYFFYDQSFMAMQAAWLLDLPRGVSCYADHMMNDYPWKFVPLHIELCDVIVATSARIKRELSQLSGGKYDDKIIVKPNGVDGDRFKAQKRPARNVDEPFEVLSVSRIEPKKGLTYLVEAIATLKEKGHKVIAHVIGSKDPHSKGSLEYAAEFEDCIARHGLQDQVILHGMMKQEQMPPIIERCRAFVAPYIETESGDKDGIPTAMLEALASSLPVVTTDSGSILEVIDDGVEGLVVSQRDSKAYAAALEKLITDPALEQRMAKAARTRFDRDFDIKVTEKRLHQRIAGFLAQKEKAQA
ncbi:MAG: glycosyltransferase [Planctomycetes bacterium]|nr:glycosyltransferase [Planctomycetota bacterium]